MKKSFDSYQRLAKGLFGMSSLWMGDDHLVFVKGSGFLLNFTENYRRFRYENIQYLAVTQTSRTGGIVLHSLGFLFFAGILAAILGFQDGSLGVFSIVMVALMTSGALLSLILLFRHLLLGPTCVCDLKTNLHRERIGPLGRLYQANQAIEVLSKVISEKQQHLATGGGTVDVSLSTIMPLEKDRLSIGRTVFPAFGIYAIFGIVALAALHLDSVVLCGVGLGLIVFGNMLTYRSLIRSYQKASPDSIKRLLFSLLTSVMIFGGVALVYFIQVVSSNSLFLESITGPLEAFAGIPTLGGMVYYLVFLFATLLVLIISLVGLAETLKWQKRLKQTPPPVQS